MPGLGIGSRPVGPDVTTIRDDAHFAMACAICQRCGGKGKKAPTIIAGKPTGGDSDFACFHCRGAGALLVGYLVPKKLQPFTWKVGRYEVDVKFDGEGYSMRSLRVNATSSDDARRKALEMYRQHVVVVGEPRRAV